MISGVNQLTFSAVNVLEDLIDVPEAVGCYIKVFVWEMRGLICSNRFKRCVNGGAQREDRRGRGAGWLPDLRLRDFPKAKMCPLALFPDSPILLVYLMNSLGPETAPFSDGGPVT